MTKKKAEPVVDESTDTKVVDTATKVKHPTEVEVTDAAPAAPSKKAKESVTFTLNDKAVPTRTFTADEHGKDFVALANEFAVTHQGKILGRVDA